MSVQAELPEQFLESIADEAVHTAQLGSWLR